MDQADRLAGNHGRDVEIAGGLGCRIFGGDMVFTFCNSSTSRPIQRRA